MLSDRFIKYLQWIRRYGVGWLYASAAAFLLLAAVLPSSAPILDELIIIRDVSGSVVVSSGFALPEEIEGVRRDADVVHRIAVASEAKKLSDSESWQDASASIYQGATDYEAGLKLAAAIPRTGRTRRRIILVGDGRETVGDASAMSRALARDLLVETMPLGEVPRPDARSHFLAPVSALSAVAGKPLSLVFSGSADSVRVAELTILNEAGEELARQTLRLTPAGFYANVSVTLPSPGMHELTAKIKIVGDTVPRNDSVKALIAVGGAPSILWFGKNPPAMTGAVKIESASAGELSPKMLAGYTGIVINNLPAGDFPPGAAEVFRDAVGRGKNQLVIGGENSLAAGGWEKSVVGEKSLGSLLPVLPTPRDSLALALALDSSGSMGDKVAGAGGQSKLELAASAVLESWERLAPGDLGGIIAFTGEAETLTALSPRIEDKSGNAKKRASDSLRQLAASGGTSIFNAAAAAIDMLENSRVRIRYAILITDGDTSEKDEALASAFERLEKRLEEARVLLSLVVVGNDANAALLEQFNKIGAEVNHAQGQLLLLPEILDRNIRRHREAFRVYGKIAKVGAHELLRDFDAKALPPILKYAAAGGLREGAESLLETSTGEILMAEKRLGLGRVLFVAGDPAKDWGWQTDLPSRLLRRVATSPTGAAVEVKISGDIISMTAACAGSDNGCRARLTPLAGGDETAFDLIPEKPGVAFGTCRKPPAGAYRLEIVSPETGETISEQPLMIENREEWLAFGPDGLRLSSIAISGGGELIRSGSQFTPWESVPAAGEAETGIPERLAIAGLALLLLALGISAWR